MSEKHPRCLPGFLSEEDPDSFTRARERIQSESWNTMVDTVNPGCRFDFIAALNSGQNAVPPVELSEFVHKFLGAFSWLFLYGYIIVLSCCILYFSDKQANYVSLWMSYDSAIHVHVILFHALPKTLDLFHLFKGKPAVFCIRKTKLHMYIIFFLIILIYNFPIYL